MNSRSFFMSSRITAGLSSVKRILQFLERTLLHFLPSSILLLAAANWIIQCRHWPRTNCTGRPHRSSEVISSILAVQCSIRLELWMAIWHRLKWSFWFEEFAVSLYFFSSVILWLWFTWEPVFHFATIAIRRSSSALSWTPTDLSAVSLLYPWSVIFYICPHGRFWRICFSVMWVFDLWNLRNAVSGSCVLNAQGTHPSASSERV